MLRYCVPICCAAWLLSATAAQTPPPFSPHALTLAAPPQPQWQRLDSGWPRLSAPATDAASAAAPASWELRLASGQPLRLHAATGTLCSDWQVAVSDDGLLFVQQAWSSQDADDAVLYDGRLRERVLRLSHAGGCEQMPEVFVGRLRTTPELPWQTRVENGEGAAVRQLHDLQNGSSEHWLWLAPASELRLDLPEAAEFSIESRYDYSLAAVPAAAAYTLRYAYDDGDWHSLELDASPDYASELRAEGSVRVLGELQLRTLRPPPAARTLRLQAAAPQWLRVLSYGPKAWLLPANRPEFQREDSAAERWSQSQQLAQNGSDPARLRAAEFLLDTPWDQAGGDALRRHGATWLDRHTFFAPLPPLNLALNLRDALVSIARLVPYNGAPPTLHADARFAPVLAARTTRALFAPLPDAGLSFALPADAAGLHLRLLLRGEGPARLWAAADDGKPIALELRSRPADALRTPLATVGAALLQGAAPEVVSAAEFTVPAFARRLRVWRTDSSAALELSLQQRRAAPTYWNEQDYRALVATLDADQARDLLASAIGDANDDSAGGNSAVIGRYASLREARQAQAALPQPGCAELLRQADTARPWLLRPCAPLSVARSRVAAADFLRHWQPQLEALRRAHARFRADLPAAASLPQTGAAALSAAVRDLEQAGLGASAERLLRGQVLRGATRQLRDTAAGLLTQRLHLADDRAGLTALVAARIVRQQTEVQPIWYDGALKPWRAGRMARRQAEAEDWFSLAQIWLDEGQAAAAAAVLSLQPAAERPPALTRQVAAAAGWSALLEDALVGAPEAEAQAWRRYAAALQAIPDVTPLPPVLQAPTSQDRTASVVATALWSPLLQIATGSVRAAARITPQTPLRLKALPGQALRLRLWPLSAVPASERGWVELLQGEQAQAQRLVSPLLATVPAADWVRLDGVETVFSAGSFLWRGDGDAELRVSHAALLTVDAAPPPAPDAKPELVAFTRLARPPEVPAPQARDWPEGVQWNPPRLSTAVPIENPDASTQPDCAAAQQQGVQWLWQVEHAPALDAEAAAARLHALAQNCLSAPGMHPLLTRLAADELWEPIDSASRGAGSRPLRLPADYRHSPALRALAALLPATAASELRLAGTEQLNLQLDATQPRYLRLRARLDASPGLRVQPLRLQLSRDGQALRELLLQPGNEVTTELSVPAGTHDLSVVAPDNLSGQQPLLAWQERRDGRWLPLAPEQTRLYFLATPGAPLVPDVIGPAWLRIERYAEPAPEISYRWLAAGETLQLRAPDAEAAYRIYRYRRIEGLPQAAAVATPVPLIAADAPPLPRMAPTAAPLRDVLDLNDQQGDTWVYALGARQLAAESDVNGDSSVAGTRRDLQLSLNRLRFHPRPGLYEELGGLLRRSESGRLLYGLNGLLQGYPAATPWSWQLAASAFAQNLPSPTGGRGLEAALKASADLRHHWQWERLSHTGGLGLRGRWLSLDGKNQSATDADPDVYSLYADQHPWGLSASSLWRWRLRADTQFYADLRTLSNADWNLSRPDRWSWEVGWEQWWRPLVLSAALRQRSLLADDDRPRQRDFREALFSLDWDRRVSASERLALGLQWQAGLDGGDSLRLRLAWIFDRGRGLRDERPGSRLFSGEQTRADLDLTR